MRVVERQLVDLIKKMSDGAVFCDVPDEGTSVTIKEQTIVLSNDDLLILRAILEGKITYEERSLFVHFPDKTHEVNL